MATQDFAGEASCRTGRLGWPRKHKEGYSTAKVIRILENTFVRWRELKSAKNFPDNDAVARYLLDTLPVATPAPSPSAESRRFESRYDCKMF